MVNNRQAKKLLIVQPLHTGCVVNVVLSGQSTERGKMCWEVIFRRGENYLGATEGNLEMNY